MSDQTPTDPWQNVKWRMEDGVFVYPASDVDDARALTDEQHQREIAQRDETIRQLQAQIINVTAERNAADARLAEVELELDTAEARVATLAEALKEALPFVADTYRRGGKVGLMNAGDVIEQIDTALAAAPQGRETPDPQKGAPR